MPFGACHPGVEEGVVHQVVPVGDGLEMVADLLAEGVATGGNVIELLEHGEVDIRLDVAHHARIAVPVPGTPDAPGLVDDTDPLDAGLSEVGAGEHASDPTAHNYDVDVVGDRITLGRPA